jgi:hypothetical protein
MSVTHALPRHRVNTTSTFGFIDCEDDKACICFQHCASGLNAQMLL